jgi:hypothetical protein
VSVYRQHETTTIPELAAARCDSLLAVGPVNGRGHCFFYLQANGGWNRFFIQHGILFWDPLPPDPEDDLMEGERYDDVLASLSFTASEPICDITMKEGCLTIIFADRKRLTFRELEELGVTVVDQT